VLQRVMPRPIASMLALLVVTTVANQRKLTAMS